MKSAPADRRLPTVALVWFALVLANAVKWQWLSSMLMWRLDHPVSYEPFPGWATSPGLAMVAWIFPFLTLPVWLLPQRFLRQSLLCVAVINLVSALGLLWHIQTHNDATFTVAVWGWLWIVFQLSGRDDPRPAFVSRSALGVVSLFFLGGFMGKLTPEYWTGEVIYDIYFQGKPEPFWEWVRARFSSDLLPRLAAWFSRLMIFTEAGLACLVLLPERIRILRRIGIFTGMVAIGMMAIMANIQILSVLLPLLALLLVAWRKSPVH